jgi:endoglucanase
MQPFAGFQAGANLGGWISQYPAFSQEHFNSFILEKDIQTIASWGMDHVRLPVDYPVLEDDAAPFAYRAAGLAHIDNCLAWCNAHGLNLILDLHKAPGYFFGTFTETTLFNDPQTRERFLSLWEMLARRYRGVNPDGLVFELLNEMVQPTSDPWNALAGEAFRRIRAVDPARWVMIGGNNYNSAWTLKEITLIDDPRVAYTFHFYEPMPFTHQRAAWVPDLLALNAVTPYPGMAPGVEAFLAIQSEYRQSLEKFVVTPLDLEYLRANLQPALDFLALTGAPLYCGEYGAIDHAPLDSRIRWHRDFVDLLREHNIGRAVWSYKEMNFRLVNDAGEVESEELVQIVSH